MTRFVIMLIALAAVVAGAAFLWAEPARTQQKAAAPPQQGLEVATFASGCFWCTESDFDKVDGVRETISGFMGGKTKSPTYAQVSMGNTGHAEAVQLKFDPKVVSYQQLLDYYWRHVDLLDGGGQFCDRGSQYRPVSRRHAAAEDAGRGEQMAPKSGRFSEPIAVEIDAGDFTPAGATRTIAGPPLKYRCRHACGRDARLEQLWGDEAAPGTH
jgi:peptide-methionine (S)-S-oxide reductase